MSESVLDRLQTDLVAAMKSGDAATRDTLRMLKKMLMDEKTRRAKDAVLTAEEEVEILQRYVKQRRETIESIRGTAHHDKIASEEREIQVTQRYLPEMMAEAELMPLVREAIAKTGAAGPKDMGKVIGAVMAQVKGKAEGGTVSKLVKQALGG